MPAQDCEVAVLGAGPVGMVAALELSKRYRTVLITCGLPSADEIPRVEAVPASLLALLIEYGIHPRKIGVGRLHESRLTAWDDEHYAERVGPAAAHVERPALDLAILEAVIASRRVDIVTRPPSHGPDTLAQLRRQAVRLVDSTGRSALTAGRKIHPARPWAARTFVTSTRGRDAGGELRIAALPGGYAYRLGSANHLLLGVVGRGKMLAGSPAEVERSLREHGAGWLLEGLPTVGEMTPGRTGPASVQWAEGDTAVRRVGDAALARDALSSQGLANGISEALYCAAIKDEYDEHLFALRQREQRAAHLRSLAGLIDGCRFRAAGAWKE
ncbi:MAG TPA: hypothetical protein VF611_02595, partial [Pyrinomonadaceae bacterium]